MGLDRTQEECESEVLDLKEELYNCRQDLERPLHDPTAESRLRELAAAAAERRRHREAVGERRRRREAAEAEAAAAEAAAAGQPRRRARKSTAEERQRRRGAAQPSPDQSPTAQPSPELQRDLHGLTIEDLRSRLRGREGQTGLDTEIANELLSREAGIRQAIVSRNIDLEDIYSFLGIYLEIALWNVENGMEPPEQIKAFMHELGTYNPDDKTISGIIDAYNFAYQKATSSQGSELDDCEEVMCRHGIYDRRGVRILKRLQDINDPDVGRVTSCFKEKKFCTGSGGMTKSAMKRMPSGNLLKALYSKQDLETYSSSELHALAKHHGVSTNVSKNDLCWRLALKITNGTKRYLV